MRSVLRTIPWIFLVLMISYGCAAISDRESVPSQHPIKFDTGRPNCLECHDDEVSGALKPYGSFAHTAVWLQEHGTYASQGQNLCTACHSPSWCQTCHANVEELLPSIRFGNRPDLEGPPHRGDYIVQHQIEGRVDPGSCVTCHGNRNNETCSRCHL